MYFLCKHVNCNIWITCIHILWIYIYSINYISTLNVSNTSRYTDETKSKKKKKRGESRTPTQVHFSWADALAAAIAWGHQSPASSAFDQGLTPVTLQGASKPSAHTETASLVSLSNLPVSWSEQLLVSPALPPAGGHYKTAQPLIMWTHPINPLL
jgi:hypothetical protein